ncbi:MAG: flagellar M-ring protein FliF, partial [Sphingorhabdus sp.]
MASAAAPSSTSLTAANVPRFDMLKNLSNEPAVRRAAPAIALVGGLGLAAMAWSLLSSPAQAPLYQGLADADKAAVADALGAAAIDYQMDP